MSLTCANCGQDMPDNSPFTPLEVQAAFEASHSWENVHYAFQRSVNPVSSYRLTLRGKPAQMNVAEYIPPVDMPSSEYDRQGETYKAFLILEVNGAYYRKEAHVDSYAEETWTGPVIRVNKVEKIVQVWE